MTSLADKPLFAGRSGMFDQRADLEADEADEEIIALLNAGARDDQRKSTRRDGGSAHDTDRLIRELTAESEASGTARSGSASWNDGRGFAQAAEAAGVDVGGMLEAGADPKQLLDFVSTYRRQEGEQLGLVDKQNFKFASSQVLQQEQELRPRSDSKALPPRSGLPREATRVLPRKVRAGNGRTAVFDRRGAGVEAASGDGEGRRVKTKEGSTGFRTARLPTTGTALRSTQRPSSCAAEAGARNALNRDDGAETARLCDELQRWSSALQGAEERLGQEATPAGKRTGGASDRLGGTPRTPPEYVDAESGASTSSGGGAGGSFAGDGQGFPDALSFEEERYPPRGTPNGSRMSKANTPPRLSPRRVRTKSRRPGEAAMHGYRSRTRTPESVTDSEGEAFPGRFAGRGGARGNFGTSGLSRPTPSYALPTKHFKSQNSGHDHRDETSGKDARRQGDHHRQAQLEEDNAAMKLRMQGQRRAIHELEHQANVLREEANGREAIVSHLKRKVVALTSASASAAAGGGAKKCSCCASTHRGRSWREGAASALKKRALAAETRIETLEGYLAESRAKEQRSRELVASLKQSYSASQDKVSVLEANLEAAKRSLSGVKQELAESRSEAKTRAKESRKQRRQQGQTAREVEIARAQAADLAVRLRKAVKEADRMRLEAGDLDRGKAEAEARAEELALENRTLRDRLRDGQFRTRASERDRWILSELRPSSAGASPRLGNTPTRSEISATGPRAGQRGTGHALSHERASSPRRPERARHTAGADSRLSGGRGRRRRLGEGGIGSTPVSAFASPVRSVLSSPSPSTTSSDREKKRSPPRQPIGRDVDGAKHVHVRSRAVPRLKDRRIERSTSVEETTFAQDQRRQRAASGSSAHSGMGARYERLQAMYRRVNRIDGTGARGRAGVG